MWLCSNKTLLTKPGRAKFGPWAIPLPIPALADIIHVPYLIHFIWSFPLENWMVPWMLLHCSLGQDKAKEGEDTGARLWNCASMSQRGGVGKESLRGGPRTFCWVLVWGPQDSSRRERDGHCQPTGTRKPGDRRGRECALGESHAQKKLAI